MRNRPTRVLLYLCVTTVLAAASAQAQLTTGTVSGRVVDETGAVIPGAVVTLTHDETGFKREMETDAVGSFGFIGLPPGTYTLRIEQSSFRIHETRELEVNVGKVSGLGGIVLQVGSPTEVVTVEAGTTALVQADNPEILGHYDGEVVYDVIAGFFGLDAVSFLTPGIVPGFGNIVTNTGDFGSQVGGDSGAVPAAAGQRGRSTQYSVDGHEINDTVLGGPSISLANLQAIEEYQVSVNSFDASQGRLPGAQINLITKGGTNDLHGAAFWFYEASSLRSKTSAESRFGADKPKAIQQPFGFTLGGPIIKNKWFGFGSYSRLFIPGRTLVQAQSPAFLAADAAGLAAAAGTNSTAFYASHGPFSRPFGNPRCTPGTQTVFADFGGTGLDLNACGVTRDLPAEDLTWAYTLRMDVVTNTAGTFTGRWFDEFEGFCCFGGATGFIGDNNFRGQSLTFGHTYQFSPRAINNFHFSFGRFPIFFRAVDPKADRIRDNLSTLRLPLPLLSFGGLVLPQGYIQNSFQWKDDFSYIRGRHTLKAGLEFRRNRTRLDFLPSLGSFRYVTAAQFVNDTPISTSFALGPDAIFFFETDQFYWLQDDIRLRPNLILNLGLRYEHTGQPINGLHEETLERESNPATAFWLQSLPLEQRTFPRIKSDNNNWGPRIGFAYTPRWGKRFFGEDKTVIRGGYSIAYEASFHNILVNAASAAPRIFSFLVAPGIPIPGDGTGNAVAAAIPAPLNTRDPREEFRTDVPSDFKSPYSQYWSLGLQREFGTSVVAEARYVGNRAIGQFQSVNANPLFTNAFALGLSPPGLTPCPAGSPDIPSSFQTNNSVGRVFCDSGPLRRRQNSGRSNYHGLQTRLDYRNLFNQLTGGIGFTWSKTIDNVSEIFNFSPSGSISFAQNPFDITGAERALSNLHLGRTFTAYWIWDVPMEREQRGARGKILGGWEWTGTLFLYDGRPWTPRQFVLSAVLDPSSVCGEDTIFNSVSVGSFETCRPYLGDPNAPVHTVGPVGSNARWWINDGSLGPFGVGRNPVIGDGTVLVNMGFFKNTRFGPENRLNLQFRTMVVNIFNHRNFGAPASLFLENSDSPGIGGPGLFGRPNRRDAPGRIIRFSLTLTF